MQRVPFTGPRTPTAEDPIRSDNTDRSRKRERLWKRLTSFHAPEADLATIGSSGQSTATTTNVGRGQNTPPRPTMEHSWSTSSEGSLLERNLVTER